MKREKKKIIKKIKIREKKAALTQKFLLKKLRKNNRNFLNLIVKGHKICFI